MTTTTNTKRLTIFSLALGAISGALAAEVKFVLGTDGGTYNQAWSWKGGEAAVIIYAGIRRDQTILIIRKGKKITVDRWNYTGIAPYFRSYGIETRVGMRRGPRPVPGTQAYRMAILRRGARLKRRTFTTVTAELRAA